MAVYDPGDLEDLRNLKQCLVDGELSSERLTRLLAKHRSRICGSPRGNSCIRNLKVDELAQALIPNELELSVASTGQTIVAKSVHGDGNCLYHSASTHIQGSEALSISLRILTAAEIFTRASYYSQHPCFAEAANCTATGMRSVETLKIVALSSSVLNTSDDSTDLCIEEALKREAINTCFFTSISDIHCFAYSTLFHVMALANVLNKPLFSVYPDANYGIRPLYHRIMYPEGTQRMQDMKPHMIMWTRDSNLDNRFGSIFEPNHFVPLFLSDSKDDNKAWKSLCAQFFSSSTKPLEKEIVQIDLSKEEFPPLTRNKPRERPLSNANKQKVKGKGSGGKWKPQLKFISKQWYRRRRSSDVGQPLGEWNTDDVLLRYSSTDVKEATNCSTDVQELQRNAKGNSEKWEPQLKFLSKQWYQRRCSDVGQPLGEWNSEHVPVRDRSASIKNIPEDGFFNNPNKSNHSDADEVSLPTATAETHPFQFSMANLTRTWYGKRGRLASKNWGRATFRETKIVKLESFSGIHVGSIKGSIQENKEALFQLLSETLSTKRRSELHGLIAVGELLEESVIVETQAAGKVYRQGKWDDGEKEHDKEENRGMSANYFNFFARYFNIAHFHIKGKSYIMENRKQNFQKVITQLQNIANSFDKEHVLNEKIEREIGGLFKTSLQMMDTKRDRDIVKGLFARATSVNFVAKLQKVGNKTAIMNCRDELDSNVGKYEELKKTSQIARNDMTNEAQARLYKRIVMARKGKEMKLKYDSRGRRMKVEEWPELPIVLEHIFSEGDKYDRSGGGMEAHPRLKNEILYRSKDNNTFMRQAVEIINSVSPPSFHISLSACFNYTMNYKRNTASAKRHHDGKDVNAKISLRAPPRTSVDKLVPDLHYSTAAVNYTCEIAEKNKHSVMIDSKDAKKIVCAGITPVMKPGKVWHDFELPDHDWDQSRINAVTPMTHMFLRSVVTLQENFPQNPSLNEAHLNMEDSNTVLHITRTGKIVTLINPSFLEPDTTIKLFNELFLLMTKPSLDFVFRNPVTGKLKSQFVLVVDNGPAEDPGSPMVKMLLVRMLNFLNLDKIVQVSFAEYHSKRNFVERAHAAEDAALSRHGAFSARKAHDSETIPGSAEHKANMEEMTKDVISCLKQARFAGEYLEAYRGIEPSSYIFDDEENLKAFLNLSEERKEECELSYSTVTKSPVSKKLQEIWEVNVGYEATYADDYKMLTNSFDNRTAWVDKYKTTFYRRDEEWKEAGISRNEVQPIPDFVRWIKTNGELHYLSFERSASMKGDWNETPGIFRPKRLLQLMYNLNSHPTDDVFSIIAPFVWLPEQTVREFYKEQNKRDQKELEEEQERERWKQHALFSKSVPTLQELCRKKGLYTKGQKHQLVERLVRQEGSKMPPPYNPNYTGDITTLPTSIAQLRKFSLAKLRFISNFHGLATHGCKEELCLRLFLLRTGMYHLAFKAQEDEISATVSFMEEVMLEERRQHVLNPEDTHRKRTYSSKKQRNSIISIPSDVNVTSMHKELFRPLKEYIDICREIRREKKSLIKQSQLHPDAASAGNVQDNFFVVGKNVKIKWTKDEIGDSGWKCAWYSASVQSFSREDDTINVMYYSEPDCIYTVPVSNYLSLGKLKA